MRFAVVVSMGLICLGATFTSGSAVAVTLVPGDIVAVDIVNASLIRIEASTGIAQTILSGGLLNNPRDIAVAQSGLIYVTDSTGLLVIDPVSGSQSVLADRTGSDFDRFDVAANGDIILADTINSAIDRVDPTTGTRTPISSGGLIDASGSFSVTVTDAGRIFGLRQGHDVEDFVPIEGEIGGVGDLSVQRRFGRLAYVLSDGVDDTRQLPHGAVESESSATGVAVRALCLVKRDARIEEAGE